MNTEIKLPVLIPQDIADDNPQFYKLLQGDHQKNVTELCF